tara:strand:+ start:886 stop:1497 length:612 start_codon:yes stop_codon:yes gene_type:complete
MLDNLNLLSKEDLLLDSLYSFYNEQENIEKILPIITGKSCISLRILDYFVTNYSKTFNVKIDSDVYSSSIYHDYKNKLKSYNKRFFDPFCRINKKNTTNKIAFKYTDDQVIITTIGQLNFFRWAVRLNIIDYVIENHNKINNEMIKFVTKNKNKQKKNIDVQHENKNKILNTTINFGNNKQLNIKTTKIMNNTFDIAKLEFNK